MRRRITHTRVDSHRGRGSGLRRFRRLVRRLERPAHADSWSWGSCRCAWMAVAICKRARGSEREPVCPSHGARCGERLVFLCASEWCGVAASLRKERECSEETLKEVHSWSTCCRHGGCCAHDTPSHPNPAGAEGRLGWHGGRRILGGTGDWQGGLEQWLQRRTYDAREPGRRGFSSHPRRRGQHLQLPQNRLLRHCTRMLWSDTLLHTCHG